MWTESYDMEPAIDEEIKIVMLGNQRTGKSCIMQKLIQQVFTQSYKATSGVEYDSRILEIDGKLIKIHLSDVSGQEHFLWLAKKQLSEADGFLLVYDITDRQSFYAICRWLRHLRRCTKERNPPTLLMGNKLDLQHKQSVPCSEAKEFAISEGLRHIEVSAFTGRNLTAGFYILATDILRLRKLGCPRSVCVTEPHTEGIKIHEDPSSEIKRPVESSDYIHQFKILLLGAVRSGKTSLRYRFCGNQFSPEYHSTTGFDCSTRTIEIDGENIKLQIWDLSGNGMYDETRKSLYEGANGFIVVYDVTDKGSFAQADVLLKELKMYGQSHVPKVIACNKCDVPTTKRKVDHDVVHDWSDKWNVLVVDTSSKYNINVDSIFMKIAASLKRQMSPWKRLYTFSN